MKKIFVLFVLSLFVGISVNAQSINDAAIDDDVRLDVDENYLTIFIDEDKLETYDLLIYRTFEDVKLNELSITKNPYKVDISGWESAVYHIKVDYNLVTQFRHIEL